jgi:ABC-type antimicrobial peptide transport system permease subunit
VEREIQALDPEMPISDLRTMRQSLAGALGFFVFRLGAYESGAMGLLGLTLAVVRVYGVVSYAASQRTREIGICMALGADPLTFTGVTLLLAAIALWACYVPARRAMRVDPMVALRHE